MGNNEDKEVLNEAAEIFYNFLSSHELKIASKEVAKEFRKPFIARCNRNPKKKKRVIGNLVFLSAKELLINPNILNFIPK